MIVLRVREVSSTLLAMVTATSTRKISLHPLVSLYVAMTARHRYKFCLFVRDTNQQSLHAKGKEGDESCQQQHGNGLEAAG